MRQLAAVLTGASAVRAGAAVLAVDAVVVDHPGRRVLDGLDLAVAAGEAVAVTGPSGAGKTTLLACIAGLVPVTSGRVVVAGARRAGRRADVGMVFQAGELLPELTVVENVALPALFGGRRDARGAARRQLALVGMADAADRRPGTLSGGEVQRVAVARALVDDPVLVLADEPTGALDEATALTVTALLVGSCRERGAALVVATHDPAVAAAADRVLALRRGRLVAATGTRP